MNADKTSIAVEVFDRLAEHYQQRFMDVSLYDDSFHAFCNALPKTDAEVLEVACGPGNITKALLAIRPDLKVFGTDLAPAMLDLARINNPTAVFGLLDCRDIAALDKQFDAILCGFAFPYLSKEEAIRFIHDAANRLLPDGILYISTMEDDNAKSGWQTGSTGDRIFMNFHEAGYLIEALDSDGFELIYEDRKCYPGANDTTVTDLLVIARKKA
ncbi:MAG TPA: class I SAM-dependent methyltransferase [Fluviicola sp.]|nr:class I SAM-dependent methyltransferase [Fluviicola sp.]